MLSEYSFILGILSTIRSTPCNSSLLKGLSTGFCGCASTFGTLITLASYQFVLGVRIQSKAFIVVGTGVARDAFDVILVKLNHR